MIQVREVVGATESKAMQRDRARLEARAQEEEELFARVPLSRVDRKKVKQLKQARNGLIGMLDDFEDDVGDLVGMDNAQPEKVKGSLIKDFSKQRAHSQMAKAGQFSKKSRVLLSFCIPQLRSWLYLVVWQLLVFVLASLIKLIYSIYSHDC
jgi:hypothetical protein